MKVFADDNFDLNEIGRKFLKSVENNEGKGEIAGYKQFIPFPPCFKKTCTADVQKPGLVWERVNPLPHKPHFDTLITYSCGRHCEKRRNCL